jgi:hypothetical protein
MTFVFCNEKFFTNVIQDYYYYHFKPKVLEYRVQSTEAKQKCFTVPELLELTVQCIRKVFRPLDFFHILLRYSFILKWIQLFIFLLHLHNYSDPLLINLLKHLLQRLHRRVFLGMTLQA